MFQRKHKNGRYSENYTPQKIMYRVATGELGLRDFI